MQLNPLAFAIPFFTGLMYLEYRMSLRQQKKEIFHLNEAIANLNVGIAERLTDLFATGLFYFFFSWIYQHFAHFDIKPGPITWILLFLFTDFMWYWYHRFGHEVNLFWAVHVVHHQSDDYNFTVSARITVFQAAARCLFWAVLPLLGFPPAMITFFLLIHGTYPFFTHTQLIGKLGWLEYFMVTPSHHRVHHSSNPAYLDKNYGDVLIIWDKLFGTFAKEEEAPVYGLTTPLKSHSFLWQHFHFLLEIGVAFKRAKGILAKLKIIFGKPDDIDPRIRPTLERKFSFRLPDQPPTHALLNYVKVQTVVTLLLLFITILFEHYLTSGKILVLSFFIIISVITTGAMLEQKRWIFHLEFARAGLVGIFVWLCFPYFNLTLFLVILAITVLSFYRRLEKYYNVYLSLKERNL